MNYDDYVNAPPNERLHYERECIRRILSHRHNLPHVLAATIAKLHRLGGPLALLMLEE